MGSSQSKRDKLQRTQIYRAFYCCWRIFDPCNLVGLLSVSTDFIPPSMSNCVQLGVWVTTLDQRGHSSPPNRKAFLSGPSPDVFQGPKASGGIASSENRADQNIWRWAGQKCFPVWRRR